MMLVLALANHPAATWLTQGLLRHGVTPTCLLSDATLATPHNVSEAHPTGHGSRIVIYLETGDVIDSDRITGVIDLLPAGYGQTGRTLGFGESPPFNLLRRLRAVLRAKAIPYLAMPPGPTETDEPFLAHAHHAGLALLQRDGRNAVGLADWGDEWRSLAWPMPPCPAYVIGSVLVPVGGCPRPAASVQEAARRLAQRLATPILALDFAQLDTQEWVLRGRGDFQRFIATGEAGLTAIAACLEPTRGSVGTAAPPSALR